MEGRFPEPAETAASLARLHVRFGWCALVVFVLLGTLLEGLHALKLGWYLDVPNATRRLMWTLAHAHGALLALVNVVFGLCLGTVALGGRARRLASRALLSASVLMPAGFLLGGIDAHGGDPGLGALLTPLGAGLLILAVGLTAFAALGPRSQG